MDEVRGENPRLFISYSWTSSEHEEWVLGLATELCHSGVEVILDKWDLREGQDAVAFMERMVSDPTITKVAMICDRIYAEKADGRSGGVGAETQIISPEIYARHDQKKFVAVLPERDDEGRPFLPSYYKSRIYIDLSDPDHYGKNFEQLLRWAHDKPAHVKPDVGAPPAFLDDTTSVGLFTARAFRHAIRAVKEEKLHWVGAVREYFDLFAENAEAFRIAEDGKTEYDDQVIQSIETFIPYREEVVELVKALAFYRPSKEAWDLVHRFFEKLLPYLDRPEGVRHCKEWDFDNFRFVVHELFLHTVAVLLAHDAFSGVGYLSSSPYYCPEAAGRRDEPMVPFSSVCMGMRSLEHRNKRLDLQRASLRADLLEQRCKLAGIAFHKLMQADLLLFVRDSLECLNAERWQLWWPHTLIYAMRQRGPFEIFARAQSVRNFDKLKKALGVNSKDDLLPLKQAFAEERLHLPRIQYFPVDPFGLMGFEKLATLP